MTYFFFLIGPAGCGKSTIAQKIKKKLKIKFFEGDSFHSLKNLDKMKKGNKLKFRDRLPWLININKKLKEYNQSNKEYIIACSALKKSYRNILKRDLKYVFFIYLKCKKKELIKRNLNRNHFFPVTLVDDQITNFENSKELIVINAEKNIIDVQKLVLEKIKNIIKAK
jgi:carbohydrate kinase (thermoresistant glucokinase family)